jgi:hypothetical protein
MKYFILLVFVLVSCTQVVERRIERIVEEKIKVSVNQKVFPQETISSSIITKSVQGDIDFQNGIMYVDNAFQTNGIIHTLDLSGIVGEKQVLVALHFRHVSMCDNEYGFYKIKPYNIPVEYQSASCFLNERESIVYVLTSDDGKLQWYSEYAWPYEKRVEMEIIALWYSDGVTID